MLSWLVDHANTILLLLLVAALVLGVAWWLTRRGGYLVGAGVAVALFALVWVLSLLVMTDSKRLLQTLDEVKRKLNAGDYDAAFRHFGDDKDRVELDLKGDKSQLTTRQLRDLAAKYLKKSDGGELVIWEAGVDQLQRPTAVVSFNAKLKNYPGGIARCTATCVLRAEGDWRITAIKVDTAAPIGGIGGP
jgi:hypothetical protein